MQDGNPYVWGAQEKSGEYRYGAGPEAAPQPEQEQTQTAQVLKAEDAQLAPPPQEKYVPHWTVPVPRDGGLWQLWEQCCQLKGTTLPEPDLTLDLAPDGRPMILSDAQLENEVERLRATVERGVGDFLRRVRDQQRKEDVVNLSADYVVHMAQSGMMAWVLLLPPLGGGSEATLDGAVMALKRRNVETGLDIETLSNYTMGSRYFQLFPAAWGIPTREGKDGYVVEYYPREYTREPVMNEHGDVDYRSQNYVRTIHTGDVICDIFPPEPGFDGLQVTGKVLKARVVQSARVPGGKNTQVTDDGAHLTAALDGHLEFNGKMFQVRTILEVPMDVDYSTGNIDFYGDVHIAGDVRENFVVKATGTVTIDGLVEGATVEAGGNIVITKGVLGDNKAMIRSGKSVRAKYLENCVVYATDCVYADCIMASQIYSDNRICVVSGRAAVMGGCLTAANQIEVGVLGSKVGLKTEIILGRLPMVEQERRADESEKKGIKQELSEVERQISYLEHQEGADDEKAKKLGKLRLRRSVLALKLDTLVRRIEEIAGIKPDLEHCRLKAGEVNPVTHVTIGNAMKIIMTARVSCMASYDAEEHQVKLT